MTAFEIISYTLSRKSRDHGGKQFAVPHRFQVVAEIPTLNAARAFLASHTTVERGGLFLRAVDPNAVPALPRRLMCGQRARSTIDGYSGMREQHKEGGSTNDDEV